MIIFMIMPIACLLAGFILTTERFRWSKLTTLVKSTWGPSWSRP